MYVYIYICIHMYDADPTHRPSLPKSKALRFQALVVQARLPLVRQPSPVGCRGVPVSTKTTAGEAAGRAWTVGAYVSGLPDLAGVQGLERRKERRRNPDP